MWSLVNLSAIRSLPFFFLASAVSAARKPSISVGQLLAGVHVRLGMSDSLGLRFVFSGRRNHEDHRARTDDGTFRLRTVHVKRAIRVSDKKSPSSTCQSV